MFDRISFVLGETLIALSRNKLLAFAAITTAAISLYLLGGMAYILRRADQYAQTIPSRFEMRVNLKDGTNFAKIRETAASIRGFTGVRDVVWLPREKQWEKYRKEHPDLTEGYGFTESPFPDALRVRIKDLKLGDTIANQIKTLPAVDRNGGVQYFSAEQNVISQWIQVARNLAIGLGGVLLLVSGILIFNAIQLTIESRRAEIGIMRLVGASRTVVNLPFVLEGVVHGGLGGALAVVGLVVSQAAVQSQLNEMSIGATLAPFPVASYLWALAGIGAGYGAIWSLLGILPRQKPRHR